MLPKILILLSLTLLPATLQAQGQQATAVTYDLTTESNVGTGRFASMALTANRYHVMSTRQNSGYLRGAVNVEHRLSPYWKLAGAIDMVASVHADHKVYLQQCYLNVQWHDFLLEVGSREIPPVLRNARLSAGHFAKGINSKPIPQVHIGTKDFWTVPYTKGWLQIHFDGGYGKFMDSGYREDVFLNAPTIQKGYTTGIYYHQKHLYFRSNPEKLFFVTVGIEHVAQFGGTNYAWHYGELISKSKPTNLKAFWNVILPLGDSNYYENDSMEDWVYGNHLGSMTFQLTWNMTKQQQLQVYLDNPFEDGSGIRKGNGWDGLWGIEYQNKTEGQQYVRGAVVEYFQSTNQGGPLHWDRGDYPEPIRNQITDLVVGNDDYYNHLFYSGYSHYGMTPGIPFITSPIYNKDGYNMYKDNRVKAWHVAMEGELANCLSYLLKGNYCEGWGTYNAPLVEKRHSFNAMIQGNYKLDNWNFSAAYAFGKDNIIGDNSTFNFKIGYHGKIL